MDEPTDVSGTEQASIVVRLASEEGIRDDFLGFFHAEDLTGEGLATFLCDTVTKMGLDMSLCHGLGFHGASSMMGKFKGCATVIHKKYPLVKVVHCFNHRLNLVLAKTCGIMEMKIAFNITREACDFIYGSNTRVLTLSKIR